MMAYVFNENNAKKMAYFQRFWVKEPRHAETVQDENSYLYRSTRQQQQQLLRGTLVNRTYG